MALTEILYKLLKSSRFKLQGTLLTFGDQEIVGESGYINLLREDLGGSGNDGSIVTNDVFHNLGFDKVDVLEYPGVEGASIEHDLNEPFVNDHKMAAYDVILDAGHMEHCFNVPEIMKTIMFLLKKDGLVVHFNPSQGSMNHGFYNFQPTFYFSFYRECGFTDIKVYLVEGGDPTLYGRSRVIELDENYNNMDYSPPFQSQSYLAVFARRGLNSSFKIPNIEFYDQIFRARSDLKDDEKIPKDLYNEIVGNVEGNCYERLIEKSYLL